jgi:hypothetical protein
VAAGGTVAVGATAMGVSVAAGACLVKASSVEATVVLSVSTENVGVADTAPKVAQLTLKSKTRINRRILLEEWNGLFVFTFKCSQTK